jgi:phosphoribosyl-dephospho-CoA transferase
MMTDTQFQRHTLAWLTAPGWHDARAAAPPAHQQALAMWQQHDWPVTVRRTDVDTAPHQLDVGLPLPPDAVTGAKLRIALRVARDHIARSALPLTLAAASHAAGPWREQLNQLRHEAGTSDLRVYGSIAMEALTNLPYVRPTSDIDLLYLPASQRQLEAVLAVLAHHAETLPLDGEIVFPGGQAVAWKEWLQARATAAKVLVKQLQRVSLENTELLWETLPP